jgi:hypothetical protein
MSEEELFDHMHIVGKRFGVLSPMDSAGSLVHKVQVRVNPAGASSLRGYQSNGELAFHNDACDVIAFLCVRAARAGGERRIVSAVRILRKLHEAAPGLVPPLFLPIRCQAYFEESAGLGVYSLPLLSIAGGEPYFAIKPGYVQRLIDEGNDPFVNDLHKEAFFAFMALAEDPSLALSWNVERGDLEIYDNFRVLHARGAFEDECRCLLRVWISDPNGIPLPSYFEDAPDYRFTYLSRKTRVNSSSVERK